MAYRILVWSTGLQGQGFIREVIENPDFELVGVLAYNPDKAGLDAGDLVGMPKTGVLVTNDKERMLSLAADVVLHSPKGHHLSAEIDNEVIRLLESGKSVISTRGYYWPWYYGDEYAQRLIAACQKGGSSVMGWGPNPGWITDSLAATVGQVQRRLEHMIVTESYDCSDLHEDMLKKMGFGLCAEEFQRTSINANYDEMYIPNLLSLAAKLGAKVSGIDRQHELVYAQEPINGLSVPIPSGGMQGTRRVWTALVDGKPFVSAEYLWFVGKVPTWPTTSGWQVTTHGKPNLKVVVNFNECTTEYGADEMFVDMMSSMCTRAIPLVCTAAPGIYKMPIAASTIPTGK